MRERPPDRFRVVRERAGDRQSRHGLREQRRRRALRIDANGTQKATLFLDQALNAYTPIALDHAGHVLALNAGHLLVVGTR